MLSLHLKKVGLRDLDSRPGLRVQPDQSVGMLTGELQAHRAEPTPDERVGATQLGGDGPERAPASDLTRDFGQIRVRSRPTSRHRAQATTREVT